MNNYISVNVVSQALLLLERIKHNNCYAVNEINKLKIPYGVNKNVSLSFMQQCSWISINEGVIVITPVGESIIKLFDGKTISNILWRLILKQYIVVCKPAWARRIPFGRNEALIIMNEEEKRCFYEAELVDTYCDDVIEWWDRIAEKERQEKNSSLESIGRKGERLTMSYEEMRTGRRPEWRSIETNVVGFDILSTKDQNDPKHILIEVKTSIQRMSEASMIVTRNEWETATKKNNIDRYYFYVWNLYSSTRKLAIIEVGEMMPYIPRDGEEGHWESVSIPFSVFDNMFASC